MVLKFGNRAPKKVGNIIVRQFGGDLSRSL